MNRAEQMARGRTIVIAVVCAGIVALLIGFFNDRDQRQRSVDNCHNTEEVVRTLVDVSKNVAEETPDPSVKARWNSYASKFSAAITPEAATCEKQFPKPSLIPGF